EIYVQPFSPSPDAGTSATAGSWMVSKNGGFMPRWKKDGRELYFLDYDGNMMAVEISTSPVFGHGAPTTLFKVPASLLTVSGLARARSHLGDVTADGKRFLLAVPVSTRGEQLTVELNWAAGI